MKPAPRLKWPPVIDAARAPRLVRVRDLLLTILAWALLLYLLRDGLLLVVDYFSDPIFQLTRTHSLDWMTVWNRLYLFLTMSAVTMLWLILWGLVHRRRLQLAAHAPPPNPLPLDRHAASFNFTTNGIEEWRKLKVAIVQFDGNHCITSVAAPANRLESAHPTGAKEHERIAAEKKL